MCAPLFLDVCIFIFCKKKDVFGTFLCFKVLKVNRTLSGFLLFLVSYVSFLFFFLSIALDNQLRQKDKKKKVSPQSIYIVGCLMYVHLSHII